MFESLERRVLLAATTTAAAIVDHLGVLHVNGTDGSDHIDVLRVGEHVVVFVDPLGIQTMTYDVASLQSITIDAGAGDDDVLIDERIDLSADVRGGAGNDVLTGGAGNDDLSGGPGNDVITPGPGRDSVGAGAGNDRIVSRDSQPDVIDCGPGRDMAIVDPVDRVRRCETVVRIQSPPRDGLG